MTEQRQYVRMETVFPVELEILELAGEGNPSCFLQAFTRDVSAGGLCLELKNLDGETDKFLETHDASLALTIDVPFAKRPISATAKIVWFKKEELLPRRYLLGASYTEIDEKSRVRIVRYAKRLLWIPRITAAIGIFLISILTVLFIHNQRLIYENKAIVHRLVESAEKESAISSKLYEFQKRAAVLERKLSQSSGKQEKLEQELKNISQHKEQLKARYQELKKEGAQIESTGLQQMVEWIRAHRNLHTGLVASFEGDPTLEDWAFTYDQSLACQVFILFNDLKSAEGILSFYAERAEQSDGAFFNAYDVMGGRPVENTVHVGPNIWLGIAALQYEHRVKDKHFLPLARQIGDWALRTQDEEGGLKGGPSVTWYSTEHNLDTYAFLNMLYQETGDPRYEKAAQQALDWIKKYAYSAREQRINRGKGDATIATDTFSWAIAALTPARLRELSLDPEAIMNFAETYCEVTVNYAQPGGKIAVARGFDFAKAQNIGRGGIISTEWTAQAIVTYQIMSDYFGSLGEKEKASHYYEKASFYLNELQKLVITSPSRTGQGRGCLPYASIDNADTGHGWRTPKGQRTGSVSGTAYGIFAWVGYNPFSLRR